MPHLRLPQFSYQGSYAYFITVTCFKRQNNLVQPRIVHSFITILHAEAKQQSFSVLAYCFMPDHIHLLLEGKDKSSDIRKLIRLFKQKTGFAFRKAFAKTLWQRSYYDHVVRAEENLESIAYYILNNPVKAGLVNNYWEYQFLGSFFYDSGATFG